jgi:hypothetical protein
MRDAMIVRFSPTSAMGTDRNIERHIGYIKIARPVRGKEHTWDRLGDLGACCGEMKNARDNMRENLGGTYLGSRHTTPDTSHLVWRVAEKVQDLGLHIADIYRPENKSVSLVKHTIRMGAKTLKSSTLKTWNKKLEARIQGRAYNEPDRMELEDEVPPSEIIVEEPNYWDDEVED